MQASPISTPEKWMSLSSPIMISSISLQLPSFTDSGLSKVEAISPPASRSSPCQILQPAAASILIYLACGEGSHIIELRQSNALIGRSCSMYDPQAGYEAAGERRVIHPSVHRATGKATETNL